MGQWQGDQIIVDPNEIENGEHSKPGAKLNLAKKYLEWEQNKLLPSNKKRQRDGNLSLCELMTIVLYFYLSPCRDIYFPLNEHSTDYSN